MLRGAQMAGFLDGTKEKPSPTMIVKKDEKDVTVVNPAHAEWVAQEQQVLSYLLLSLSREVLSQVVAVSTAAGVWEAIGGMFMSQSKARAINTRMALATTQKGNLSVINYVNKMRGLADEMTAAGKKLDDEDLVSYILAGLDFDYDPVVSVVAARVEPISVSELITQLISFEQRLELRQGMAQANTAMRGRGNGGQRGRGRGNANPGGRSPAQGGRSGFGGNQERPKCQLCGKLGHTVIKCFKRLDTSFTGEEKAANVATTSYGIDTNWYVDTGATDHVTGELDMLTVRDKYTGNEQVHAVNGAGMEISHIGHATVPIPSGNLVLKNVLYVPEATKNLVSASRLAFDIDAFVELHPYHFSIKDRDTRRLLHRSRCKGRLYPLKLSSPSANKSAFGVHKISDPVARSLRSSVIHYRQASS